VVSTFALSTISATSVISVPDGRASALELAHDWVMTRELIHLAFPSVGREHDWIAEDIATYVEPIARAGRLSQDRVWADLVRGLPQGLPQPDPTVGAERLERTIEGAGPYHAEPAE
jgi:hypothetical protein